MTAPMVTFRNIQQIYMIDNQCCESPSSGSFVISATVLRVIFHPLLADGFGFCWVAFFPLVITKDSFLSRKFQPTFMRLLLKNLGMQSTILLEIREDYLSVDEVIGFLMSQSVL